jgi:hypothetical protein
MRGQFHAPRKQERKRQMSDTWTKTRIVGAATAVAIAAAIGTAVPASAQSTCTTSAQYGECFTGDNPYVQQNVWNATADPGWSQTLTATSATHWTIAANMAAGNRAVISYPGLVDTTDNDPVSGYAKLYGEWHDSLPASPGSTDDYEAAFDIWLNGNYSDPDAQEIMVWTDTYHQTPAGSNTGVKWTDPTFGAVYDVWTNSANTTVTLVAQKNATEGDVDLKSLLTYVSTKYSYDGDNLLNQVDYGFEICSTSGKTETFANDGWALYT